MRTCMFTECEQNCLLAFCEQDFLFTKYWQKSVHKMLTKSCPRLWSTFPRVSRRGSHAHFPSDVFRVCRCFPSLHLSSNSLPAFSRRFLYVEMRRRRISPVLGRGVAAAAGSTFNYFIVVAREIVAHMRPKPNAVQQSAPSAPVRQPDTSGPVRPVGAGQWALFIFRELFRSDFCFIVIALAVTGQTWLLLPALPAMTPGG